MDRTLKLGCAYHGNRILRHVEEDMTDIVNHHMNTVVHMYTHNDMDRHASILKDIISVSEDKGLEVWVDNWGIDDGPGDKAYFPAQHPEAKMIYQDGTPEQIKPCYNAPAFRDFTKRWVDAVALAGGKILFWDEPWIPTDKIHGKACFCSICRKKFADKYNKPMKDATVVEFDEFRDDTIVDYFRFATDYAHDCGMINTGCIKFAEAQGSGFNLIKKLMKLPHFDNVGCDPYWIGSNKNYQTAEAVYRYNFERTAENLLYCKQFKKDHNVWLQSFAIPRRREDEMVIAANAIYDAGARTIFSWSFRGGESNNYRCTDCDMAWDLNGQIMQMLRERHFNNMLSAIRTIKNN